MVPSKCRPATGGRPGPPVSSTNYGLHLVLQASAERSKPLEFRIQKEQPYLHNRLLQHDIEKNYSGKLVDGRLSPLSRSKKVYIPVSSQFADVPGLDMKHGSDSLLAFGDCTFSNASKYRIQHGSHSANPHISEVTYGNASFPLVHRTAEEKMLQSDKLTLERQKLTVCPIIDGEEHLRLLSLQHNSITWIQNISNLHHLIYLDLSDNQIEEISGLSTLRSLRVLLLGNNRVKRITNLDNLENLDVLDLHGNQISSIENLNHLTDLRVLNLARNCLTCVENLNGLDSLTELNLRYNQITSVKDVDTLPSLQRLFLSFNSISRFSDIVCLSDSTSLSDVTLDGNPIAQETWYKHTILHHMMQLRQLDMKKITEEERRMASLTLRREEEKKRESHKQALLKEKKRLTISNIARHWESRFCLQSSSRDNTDGESSHSERSAVYVFPEEIRSLDSLLNKTTQVLSAVDTHLVEIDGDTLYLYGSGALESLDRNWSVQTAGNIFTVFFIFIDYDEIVPVLPKLRTKFPSCVHLKFKETNLVKLQQFNALAHLRRLEQLTVDAQGNPVVTFTLWKYYVIFRLSHFNLQKINGIEVMPDDMVLAEKLFGVLAYVATSDLPYCRLLSLLGDSRKKQLCYLLEGKGKKLVPASEESNDHRKLAGENANRSPLNYATRDSQTEKLEETKNRRKFCHAYIQDLVKEASDINMKNEALQKLWPQMFIELVRDAVLEINNKESYMKICLQRIIDQKP